ncbi:hypothetical protein ES288_D02G195100v1 [Gossypium darwinii]|uniref:Uncharacterized protein n=1 Tax=Gossypium darwinii TaxID=34276 RepID=A0A5D2DHL9_GOSDA|nr:hypothetical protein ES288_D02G195100v1 [Gossypium darwinii]
MLHLSEVDKYFLYMSQITISHIYVPPGLFFPLGFSWNPCLALVVLNINHLLFSFEDMDKWSRLHVLWKNQMLYL